MNISLIEYNFLNKPCDGNYKLRHDLKSVYPCGVVAKQGHD